MDIFYGGSSVLSWRQLRGRSCVTSGRFPATKSRIFPLRLVLLCCEEEEGSGWAVSIPLRNSTLRPSWASATGADLSLFLSRTGSSCWGGNVTSQLHGAAAAAEAAVFFRWRCNAGREAGRVSQTWKRELRCWKLSSVGLIPAAARWIHHLLLCCWCSTEWLRVQRFTNSERERGHQRSASSAGSCYCVLFTMVAVSPVEIPTHAHPDVMAWSVPPQPVTLKGRRSGAPGGAENQRPCWTDAQASRGRWCHSVLG